jgi:peptidyl-prolyl cis-trans isomerase B (cyclophilin B)
MLGGGDPGNMIPAEFRSSLFHHKGAIAAARQGDDMNPKKASSGSQFYIVQERKLSAGFFDSLEEYKKIKLPIEQKEAYTKMGGTIHLDGSYTVFGEVIKGLDVIDSIATIKTDSLDIPINDVRIIKMKLVKRTK